VREKIPSDEKSGEQEEHRGGCERGGEAAFGSNREGRGGRNVRGIGWRGCRRRKRSWCVSGRDGVEMSAGNRACGDGSDEAVAALGKSFDEAGIVGFVGKGVAELVDGGVEAVLEIDEGVFGPEAFLELLAGDDEAGLFQEDGENLEGAILDFQADAGFAQFTGEQIGLVGAETDE
jgi:hypothetical protein